MDNHTSPFSLAYKIPALGPILATFGRFIPSKN